MPIDKVLSVSIANAAINASAISNTANLVIGALNTGNTVVTGNLTSNTISLNIAGGQGTYPVQINVSGNGSYMRLTTSFAANLTTGGSIVHVFGKANSQYNSGYIGFEQSADNSSNNYVKIGMYGVDDVLNVTSRGSVGINTTAPIPHNGNNALVVKGIGSRGIIELWDGSAVPGKAVFQQVGGNTYVGSLDKSTGSGSLILLTNGAGASATEAMILNGNSHVITPFQPMFIATKSGNEEPTTLTKLNFDQLNANNGAFFNTANATFTAPVTGTYIVNFRGWYKTGTVGTASVFLYKNNGNYSEVRINYPTAPSDYITFTPSWTIRLAAGDFIDIRGTGTANSCLHSSSGITYSEFSGYFLG